MDDLQKREYVHVKTKLANNGIKYTKVIKHNGDKFEYEDFLISGKWNIHVL